MTTALRDSALAVLREAHWAAKALRSVEQRRSIDKATKALAALFRKQGALVLEKLPRLAGFFLYQQVREAAYDQDLVDVFAGVFATTRPQAERAMFNALFDGLTQGYAALSGDFGLETSFKIAPERATAWARTSAAAKVTAIDETTEATIREIVTKGISEGKSYGEVGREIKGRFAEFAEGVPQEHLRSRAELVAVQENAMAYEAGQSELVDQIEAVGIRMEKSLAGPNDDKTSEICRAALALGWIARDEPFPGGEMTAPLHVGCRHSTAYRVAED